jgi:hypothetical protein
MQEQLLKIHLVFLPQFGVFQKCISLHPKVDIVKKKVVFAHMYPWTSLNGTDMNRQFIHPWGISEKEYIEYETLLPGSWRSNSGQPIIPLKSIPWKIS